MLHLDAGIVGIPAATCMYALNMTSNCSDAPCSLYTTSLMADKCAAFKTCVPKLFFVETCMVVSVEVSAIAWADGLPVQS